MKLPILWPMKWWTKVFKGTTLLVIVNVGFTLLGIKYWLTPMAVCTYRRQAGIVC
jgi:hypothetical protein